MSFMETYGAAKISKRTSHEYMVLHLVYGEKGVMVKARA